VSVTRRLIINADGFGFGPGATQGIFDAISEGKCISSVSVNANFPDAERLPKLVKAFPHLSIGVHLNPMVGEPCLSPHQVPSLVGPDGCLHHRDFLRRLRQGAIALQELEAELHRQISRVHALAGDRLTHIDSQGHSHLHYFDLFLDLARHWGLQRMRTNASVICLEAPQPQVSRWQVYLRKPHVWLAHQYRRHQMRQARVSGMRMADGLVIVGYAGTGNKAAPHNWRRILQNLPAGTYEMHCHPAYPDDTLRRWSYYYNDRAGELAILRSAELGEMVRETGVDMVSFHAI
jgi:chitin disaccharide deacetylase